jgi:predicted Rossmann-fold nucleotide-binding protein
MRKENEVQGMSNLRSVCVYCGASGDVRPDYIALAERLGRELAKRDIRLVYGGGGVGLWPSSTKTASGRPSSS